MSHIYYAVLMNWANFLHQKNDKPSPNINLKFGPVSVLDIKASLEIGIFRNPLIGFHLVKLLVIKVGQNGFSGFKAIKIGVTKENSNTLIFDKNQEAACPVTMELKKKLLEKIPFQTSFPCIIFLAFISVTQLRTRMKITVNLKEGSEV